MAFWPCEQSPEIVFSFLHQENQNEQIPRSGRHHRCCCLGCLWQKRSRCTRTRTRCRSCTCTCCSTCSCRCRTCCSTCTCWRSCRCACYWQVMLFRPGLTGMANKKPRFAGFFIGLNRSAQLGSNQAEYFVGILGLLWLTIGIQNPDQDLPWRPIHQADAVLGHHALFFLAAKKTG